MEQVTAYKSMDGLVFTTKVLCVIHELKYTVAHKFLERMGKNGQDGFDLTKEELVILSDIICNVLIQDDSIILDYLKGLDKNVTEK